MSGERRRACLVVAGLLLASGADAASDAEAAAAAAQRAAQASDGALGTVTALTTEIGPRFAGSAGDAAAIPWVEERLRALGFPKVWREAVTVPRWLRGEASAELLAPVPRRLALLALGGSVATPDGGVTAELLGAENIAALEAMSDDQVRGKVVFFWQRMRRSVDGAGYGETVPIRGRGAIAAAKKGALGVLIRSVGTDQNRLPHTGGMRYEEGTPRIPAAALAAPDAELVERLLAAGRSVRVRLTLTARTEGEAESANVLAEFPGRARPEEIVLLVAHRDSWDVGQGAQDNGTGVALVMEAARLAAAAAPGGAPRRTLRVLLTANEEFGLSGARAYAAAHASELPRHVLAIEADSGAGRAVALSTRFAAADAGARDELARLLLPLGVPAVTREAGGGADLSRLLPFGVPVVDLEQDRTYYFDVHHTDNDTLDKIDPADLRQLAAAFATVAAWGTERAARLAPAPPPPPEQP